MALFSFVLPIFEKTFNYYLRLDPESEQRLLKIAGKTIAIELPQSGKRVYLAIDDDYVQLFETYDGAVDLILRGTPFDFLQLSLAKNDSVAVFNTEVVLEGDTELARQFKAIFAELEVDWEEQLSHVAGDVIAHQVGKGMRAFCQWVKQSTDTMQQNVTEYLQEEIRLLPGREELQDFFAMTDVLRDDVERLALRIQRLVETHEII